MCRQVIHYTCLGSYRHSAAMPIWGQTTFQRCAGRSGGPFLFDKYAAHDYFILLVPYPIWTNGFYAFALWLNLGYQNVVGHLARKVVRIGFV